MKVLIVNAILYTSESTEVRKVDTIKDTMIYDLCTSFHNKGHEVTLVAAEEYKPIKNEKYPFRIIWLKSFLKPIFIANKIPCNIDIKKILKRETFDLIICSEVFSLDTLFAVRYAKEKSQIIIWQEMAFHQKMFKNMASKIWHNTIVRYVFKNIKIVPRTDNAKKFISKYSNNVSNSIIPHGVNLNKFIVSDEKDKSFVICSQLIKRKRIHKSINAFSDYIEKVDCDFKLYILGDGEEKNNLIKLCEEKNITSNVYFTGNLSHEKMIKYLNRAKAMLVYTEKDNSMISIAEALAVATPVITTSIPDNSKVINEKKLGIVKDNWNYFDLINIVNNNEEYISNCLRYRKEIGNDRNVDLFIDELE